MVIAARHFRLSEEFQLFRCSLNYLNHLRVSVIAQLVKNPPAM